MLSLIFEEQAKVYSAMSREICKICGNPQELCPTFNLYPIRTVDKYDHLYNFQYLSAPN